MKLFFCFLLFPYLVFAATHTFKTEGETFLLDGKPFVIKSGEMHYPRIPRPYWRDRMRKAKAMGLNTICTYVFWNLHEPKPGEFNFSDNLDIAAFVRTAQEEGLWVIVRPGPYICSEWEFGGLPAWLLQSRDIQVRSPDPRFIEATERYLKRLAHELIPYQLSHGGPILMMQVENEYGSFGTDPEYMYLMHEKFMTAGFDAMLFTSDGSEESFLQHGSLPHILAAINFDNEPEIEFVNLEHFRQNVPRFCGEFWVGWFDHWGTEHSVKDIKTVVERIEWMISRGISFNLYMFHGGTTFGFMNGANFFNQKYWSDVSSYDYDAPLDEAGRPTPKYYAIREMLQRYLAPGEKFPTLPAPQGMIELPPLRFQESAPLFSLLKKPVEVTHPLSMEKLGQQYGFTLYRKSFPAAVQGKLDIGEARDYVIALQGSRILGVLDRRLNQHDLDIAIQSEVPLDLLVENMGRINFGKQLIDEYKGLIYPVTLNGHEVLNWEIYTLPLTDLSALPFSKGHCEAPAFYRAAFKLDKLGDTYLDMTGWGKGHVWVNGHHLGRYWKIGPQTKMFIPAVWLKKGQNEIIVLDLEKRQ